MFELTYEEYKNYALDRVNRYKYHNLIKAVDKFVDSEKGYVFYPRNLYLEEKAIELNFFNREEAIIIRESDDEVILRFIKLKNAKSIEFSYEGSERKGFSLAINMSDGESINLDSERDTEPGSVTLFNQMIEKVFKEIK